MAQPLAVLHVGPSPRYPGGIGAVMAVLTAHAPLPASVVASWEPASRSRRALLLVRAASRIARAPRSTVVHVHMAADGSAVRKGLLMLLGRATGHVVVATVHGSRFEAFAAERPRLAGWALRQADALFVLSPALLALAAAHAPGTPAELVANPVEVDAEIGEAGLRDPVVVFSGEIGRRKGVDTLIAAWPVVRQRVAGARLVVIGPQGDVVVPQLEGIELVGPVPREQVRPRLRTARIVVLPSRAEALPMALLEAMGTGTAFLATDVGDIARLVASGGGRLVPVDDADALADALVDLLRDPPLTTQLGRAGWEACRAEFSAEQVAAQLAASYPEMRD